MVFLKANKPIFLQISKEFNFLACETTGSILSSALGIVLELRL